MTSLTKIPSGVQYFFDDEVKLRRQVERRVTEVFAGWSYDEIILPIFDYHDLFARGMGREQAEKTYRFVDRDGALLALRPELTSLVARTVATRFVRRSRPIRLFYSGEVFRYDEPTERAAREFHQIGIEHIGSEGTAADIEILLVAAEALTALGIADFRMALSHVDFFNGIACELGLSAADRGVLRELIDRRNSHSLDRFLQLHAPTMDEGRRSAFCQLTQVAGKKTAIDQARAVLVNPQSLAAIDSLQRIFETLSALGLSENFDVDLGDTGGLEYYTGLTFKVFIPEWGSEIGGGGRYDNLIGNFGAQEPAVGFSLSLDGLVAAISHRGKPVSSEAEQLTRSITIGGQFGEAFREARSRRARGERVKIEDGRRVSQD
ncbi:MAG: ATP phosphoribosyltransferase regulatory subunit [Acidobacteriota bacterium]